MNREGIIRRAVAHWPTKELHGPAELSHLLVEQSKHAIGQYCLSYIDGNDEILDVDHNYWRPIALVDLDTGMVDDLDEVVVAVRSGLSWELAAEEVSS